MHELPDSTSSKPQVALKEDPSSTVLDWGNRLNWGPCGSSSGTERIKKDCYCTSPKWTGRQRSLWNKLFSYNQHRLHENHKMYKVHKFPSHRCVS